MPTAQPRNFFAAIAQAATTRPDADFLLLPGRGTVNFRATLAAAARFAHVLASWGVTPGDRVMVQAGKSAEAIFLYLACLRIGAVYVPLNTGYTPAEVAYFIGDAEPKLFVASPAGHDKIAAIAPDLKVLTLSDDGQGGTLPEQAVGQLDDFPDAAIGMNDLASILYTSGTTGRSKGAMLSHGNLWSNAETLRDIWHFTDRDVLLHALPIFHIHGLFVATNVSLLAGAKMVLLPKFDPDAIFEGLPKATALMGVPTFYTRLLADPRLSRETTGHMRLFISGSAPLLAETHRQWQARTGHAILERYGMTETNMIASNPYDGERVPGSVGYALPGVAVRIADDAGAALPPGAVGMIEVRGPNVFQGYWRMPDKTKDEFRKDGFFITGDLGTQEPDGRIRIVGRGKDLIISGGFNVYPKEIESLIDAIAGVAESAVVGLPHADFGEGVTAVCVCEAGAALTEEAVLAALKDKLAKFKQPKRVLFVDDLPRNTMGKVQKNVLRDSYRDLYGKG